MLKKAKELHPNALFVAHPECNLDVLNEAAYVGSTKQLIEYVTASDAKEFIIGTEVGVIHEMEKRNPGKKFYILSDRLKCFEMKLTRLEDLYNCLKDETNEIEISKEVSEKAVKCVNKMLDFSK